MPVSLRSRYSRLPVYRAIDKQGNAHSTIPIRRHRERATDAEGFKHTLKAPETIEYLAWRYYGSSEEWWRIADARPLSFPLDIPPGSRVAIPYIERVGLVERGRRF